MYQQWPPCAVNHDLVSIVFTPAATCVARGWILLVAPYCLWSIFISSFLPIVIMLCGAVSCRRHGVTISVIFFFSLSSNKNRRAPGDDLRLAGIKFINAFKA
jgi:hypothetical protein